MAQILLVDDEEDSRYVTELFLKKEKHDVVTADSANEALQIINDTSFDLVLTDYNMPDVSGLELTRILKEDETTRNIPVIIITAKKVESEDIAKGLNVGADDYLTKPIDELELQARIRSIVRIKKLQEQLIHAERLETITKMAITVNHEINNPLSVIIGVIELILHNKQITDVKTLEQLQRVLENAKRIQTITQKLNQVTEPVLKKMGGFEFIDLDKSIKK